MVPVKNTNIATASCDKYKYSEKVEQLPDVSKSPLAPGHFPRIPEIAGVRLAVAAAGIKYRRRNDLLLVALSQGTTAAGVFTRSSTASAPVVWCRDNIASGRARALLVNSGNANAFTGDQGMRDVRWSAERTAKGLACRSTGVLVASTGVIGEPLPVKRIDAVFPRLIEDLGNASWYQAARAITTTDTFPKGAYRKCWIGDSEVTIAGIAKGSGMIAPDMATMLAFVFTDARIPVSVLKSVHSATVDRSFNCITVDSDTSTSDTVVLAATGQARNIKPDGISDRTLNNFKQALLEVYVDLATQVVKDGEGASKFITIGVEGASSNAAARKVGLAIAESPLVKTAIAGEDANWGRIVMAVGKSQVQVDQRLLSISLGGVIIAHRGQRVAGYTESIVDQHLTGSDIEITVDLGLGSGRARVWTCDLTHEYIRINADYRT